AVLVHSLMATPLQRAWWALACNLAFVTSYIDNAVQLLPLAGFVVAGYIGVEANRRARSSAVLWTTVALMVAGFVFLKKYSFLGAGAQLPFPYLLIGLSYVLFRLLHLIVDARQGELDRRIPALAFFNYTCGFLTFVAGPIQRYQDFAQQAAVVPRPDADEVWQATARVVRGFVKVGVVSAAMKYLFDTASGRLFDPAQATATVGVSAWLLYLTAAVFYTGYLYANFAGYMDIVIGVGRLLGQGLPENFNQPFLSRSFLDFWSRWHMTLSDWFKTYLFNPLLTWMATRFTAPSAGPYLGVAAFFVTFLVMGLWHGSTAVFAIYGLLMAFGASANKLWLVMAVARFGKKRYRAMGEQPWAVYLSRGLTLAYFALALTCLWVDMPQLAGLWSRVGPVGLLACYGGLAGLAALAFFASDQVAAWARPGLQGLVRHSGGAVVRQLGLGLQVLMIFSVSSFFHKAPEFVYRAF
ncbi:MAG: hypothetical protein JWQ88_1443, partial [Rhodoferax sp.]|nr:hypothetical protein [Rhodoferax sp.]